MYYLCSIYVLHMPCILHTYQLIGLVSQALHNPVSLDWWDFMVCWWISTAIAAIDSRPVRESLNKKKVFLGWTERWLTSPEWAGKWCFRQAIVGTFGRRTPHHLILDAAGKRIHLLCCSFYHILPTC